MSDEPTLFGDDDPSTAGSNPTAAPSLVASWQVDLLRKTLDARGLTDMVSRQQAIESVVGRPVESLRSLGPEEAMRALDQLGRASESRPASNSSWDDRTEDTWIDRT